MSAKNRFIIAKWEEIVDKYELERVFLRYMGANYKSLLKVGTFYLVITAYL